MKLLSILIILLIFPFNTHGESIPGYNSKGHFHYQVNNSWVQISVSEISEYEETINVKDKYLTGFYLDSNKYGTWPYILIEFKKTRKQMTIKEISKIRDNLAGYNKTVNVNNDSVNKVLKEIGMGSPKVKLGSNVKLDVDSKILTISNIKVTAKPYDITVKTSYLFGCNGILQVSYMSESSVYNNYVVEFDEFVNTIIFDKHYQYR